MKNIIDSKSPIVNRYENTVRPEGQEFLYEDKFNSKKLHHIIINDLGQVFYNQAIECPVIERNGKVLQEACVQDFYEKWALVEVVDFHGYREYMEAAQEERELAIVDKIIDEVFAEDIAQASCDSCQDDVSIDCHDCEQHQAAGI